MKTEFPFTHKSRTDASSTGAGSVTMGKANGSRRTTPVVTKPIIISIVEMEIEVMDKLTWEKDSHHK